MQYDKNTYITLKNTIVSYLSVHPNHIYGMQSGWVISPRWDGTKAGVYYVHEGRTTAQLLRMYTKDAIKRYMNDLMTCPDIEVHYMPETLSSEVFLEVRKVS